MKKPDWFITRKKTGHVLSTVHPSLSYLTKEPKSFKEMSAGADPFSVSYLKGYVQAFTHAIVLMQHLSSQGMSINQIILEFMGILNEDLTPKLDVLIKKVSE